MEPTSEPERKDRPGRRIWVALIGAVVLYLVVFEGLERLTAPDSPPANALAEDPAHPPEQVRPVVTRIEDGLEVSVGMYRTTVRLDETEGSVDDLVACVETGIDRAVAEDRLTGAPASNGLIGRLITDAEIAEEMNRIVDACFHGALGLPPVPPTVD